MSEAYDSAFCSYKSYGDTEVEGGKIQRWQGHKKSVSSESTFRFPSRTIGLVRDNWFLRVGSNVAAGVSRIEIYNLERWVSPRSDRPVLRSTDINGEMHA